MRSSASAQEGLHKAGSSLGSFAVASEDAAFAATRRCA
ncbi:hypothetical protein HMPREF1155_1699 [Slackia sp. CM382]|nr:hypothetical protein HMPREF1155_1699 [Slackia sp. CM382]